MGLAALTHSTVQVALVASPFRAERIVRRVPAGGSITDILLALGLPPDFPARVFIDDVAVGDDDRGAAIPTSNQVVVIRAVAGLPAVAALAVAIAAAGAGTAGATAAGFAVGTFAFSVASAAITGAVGLLGTLALNALIPPPAPASKGISSMPASFSISGPSNALVPYAPIPRVYAGDPVFGGGRKVTPMLAAQPYTEIAGNEQFLRMLFTCGFGPLDMRQLKIASSLVTNFQDVEWEMRAGYPDDAPCTLYPNDIDEQDMNVLLLDTTGDNTAPTGWQTQTTGVNADEISIDITCPNGLKTINNVGNARQLIVTLQVRFAPTGTTAWQYVNLYGAVSSDSTTAILLSGTTGDIVRSSIQWKVARGQYDVQVAVTYVTWLPNRSLVETIFGSTFWTALRTIRIASPVAQPGLSLIALRIRASNQLNGAISNLSVIASSILPDWDSVAQSWGSRAGSWEYDYDTSGADATYGLDSVTPQTAGGKALQITTENATDIAGVASRAIPVLGWQQTTMTISGWYKASKAISQGARLRVLFGADDNFQAQTAPDWLSGTAYAVGAKITPLAGNPGNYTYVCITAGTSGSGEPSWPQGITDTIDDGPTLLWKNLGGPPLMSIDVAPATTPATTAWQQVSGTVKVPYGTAVEWAGAITYFSGDVVTYENEWYLCITSNQNTPPAGQHSDFWQQISPTQAFGANFLRVVVYNAEGGAGVTVEWDNLAVQTMPTGTASWQLGVDYPLGTVVLFEGNLYTCIANNNTNISPVATTYWQLWMTPVETNVTNILPNPSFDTIGVMTGNPASVLRDILEGSANQRPVGDSRLDLPGLQAWHEYAASNGYLCNAVFDKAGTVYAAMRQVAAAGRASLVMNDALYSVVLDQPQTQPVQHVTPRNSWGYKAVKSFPDLPQALRVRFINSSVDYATDEIVVYDDGYSADGAGATGSIVAGSDQLTGVTPAANAANTQNLAGWAAGGAITVAGAGPGGAPLQTTIAAINGSTFTLASAAATTVANAVVSGLQAAVLFEAMDETEVVASPDGVQPWRDGRYHLAQGRLRPTQRQVSMDLENLVASRGSLVYVGHDVPAWGCGWGRLKAVGLDGGQNVITVATDETFIGDGSSTYVIRVRRSDGVSILAQVGVIGTQGTKTLSIVEYWNGTVWTAGPIPASSPQIAIGDLVMFGVLNEESQQCLVTVVEPQGNLNALLTMVDYNPAVYEAEQAPMPPFQTALVAINVPASPVITGVRSDQTVMVPPTLNGALN